MLNLETALTQFFKQFTANVFVEARMPPDPDMRLFPRITFNYSSTDFFGRTLYNFNVWGFNVADVVAIIDKIEQTIPVSTGTIIDVKGGVIYEYFNYHTNMWTEFQLTELNDIFQQHIDDFGLPPTYEFKWRQSESKLKGKIALYRGTPFIQPVADDTIGVARYYGNIEVASYLI